MISGSALYQFYLEVIYKMSAPINNHEFLRAAEVTSFFLFTYFDGLIVVESSQMPLDGDKLIFQVPIRSGRLWQWDVILSHIPIVSAYISFRKRREGSYEK